MKLKMKINLKLIKRIENITNNIDVLKLIIKSNYEGIIPTIEELTKTLENKYPPETIITGQRLYLEKKIYEEN